MYTIHFPCFTDQSAYPQRVAFRGAEGEARRLPEKMRSAPLSEKVRFLLGRSATRQETEKTLSGSEQPNGYVSYAELIDKSGGGAAAVRKITLHTPKIQSFQTRTPKSTVSDQRQKTEESNRAVGDDFRKSELVSTMIAADGIRFNQIARIFNAASYPDLRRKASQEPRATTDQELDAAA